MATILYNRGINDAGYTTQRGGKYICPYFSVWKDMLRRCYDEKYLQRKPTYRGCSVCKEWLTFSNFKAWMMQQNWEGMQLDKDIQFPGNKLYGPEACLFVDNRLNMVLSGQESNKELPTGVSYDSARELYRATCQDFNSKYVGIGRYKTIREAHNAYRKFKASVLSQYMKEYTCSKTLSGIQKHIDKLLLIWETPSFKILEV